MHPAPWHGGCRVRHAAGKPGDPQERSRGTIGGSLASPRLGVRCARFAFAVEIGVCDATVLGAHNDEPISQPAIQHGLHTPAGASDNVR